MWARVFACVLAFVLCAGTARAFNPPVDSAGPITVRIEGPERVAEVGVGIPVQVIVENSSREPAFGQVRLEVIDDWMVRPAAAQDIIVPAGGRSASDFTVAAGPGTFNAHYPIHAYATFRVGGEEYTAHPILILETALPHPPQAAGEVAWRPIEPAANSALKLAAVPTHRVLIAVFGEEARVMPIGWCESDGETLANAEFGMPVARGAVLDSIQMHPPWWEGRNGSIAAEFPIALPETLPIELRFGMAIRTHNADQGEPPSDGVTFRVRIAPWDAPEGEQGMVVFEWHTAAKIWERATVDLSAYAGRTVRLQLESHPGPDNDTTCDQSYWGDPVLVAGTPAPRGVSAKGQPVWQGLIKQDGARYTVAARLGARGLLDGRIELDGDALSFEGLRVRVFGMELSDSAAPYRLVDVAEEHARGQYRVRHRFDGSAGAFDLLIGLDTAKGALQTRVWLENMPEPKPWQVAHLERVALGPWNRRAKRVYASVGNVVEDPEAFTLHFDGHQLATSFVGYDFDGGPALVEAVDVPPQLFRVDPESRTYTLESSAAQTITLIPAANVWDAVKTWRELDTREAAGGVEALAGRFVFDLWGGEYGTSADLLGDAFRYGLTDAVVVWHVWQRWGYDYRLPDICPPNPEFGTVEELSRLIDTCSDHGVLFALHDNYIDFYPDSDGYTYHNIAFTQNRQPIRGWWNSGRKAQAYRPRPDRLEPFIKRNMALIREGYAPTAYFIDVWSSVGPHPYWTDDGRFFDALYTRGEWGRWFAWIREYLGGAPQISESGHDQLIGWLDGAQTNHLRVDADPPEGAWCVWRVKCADAERIPWIDAVHHARFALHGAGYPGRYSGGLDATVHGIYSDDYVATEVLTGHPAMVPEPWGRETVRMYWLLHDLMRGLALRDIEAVAFDGDNLHRQYVRWSNGAEVWVNRGADDWAIEGHVLPEFGFYARVPGGDAGSGGKGVIEAAIERRDGVIVEWSRSPAAVYCNGRRVFGKPKHGTVAVDDVRLNDDNTYTMRLRWDIRVPIEGDYRVFLHVLDEWGNIIMQGDHDPATATSQWDGVVYSEAVVPVPAELPLNRGCKVGVGLYHAHQPGRPPLAGNDDGWGRIALGTVRLEGAPGKPEHIDWIPCEPWVNPLASRTNLAGVATDFGPVVTNGSCRLTREGKDLLVTPLPDEPATEIRIRRSELPWRVKRVRNMEALGEDGTVLNTQTLREGNEVTIAAEPGVFQYRLR